MPRTYGTRRDCSAIRSHVPSWLPSSTKMISNGPPRANMTSSTADTKHATLPSSLNIGATILTTGIAGVISSTPYDVEGAPTQQAMGRPGMLECLVARYKRFYAALTGTYVLSRVL